MNKVFKQHSMKDKTLAAIMIIAIMLLIFGGCVWQNLKQ